MKRENYKTPQLEEVTFEVEAGFSGSDPEWYEKGGSGDFGYGTDVDDEWA